LRSPPGDEMPNASTALSIPREGRCLARDFRATLPAGIAAQAAVLP
jgi:hypothetical protein